MPQKYKYAIGISIALLVTVFFFLYEIVKHSPAPDPTVLVSLFLTAGMCGFLFNSGSIGNSWVCNAFDGMLVFAIVRMIIYSSLAILFIYLSNRTPKYKNKE